ncbi:hypothetical protein FOA52_003443 [Chlamydomonas sp. UWO 241]|nr:hypothetical protein FOA52_003443 [Chlamydomonas sp. UWO 241]
MCEQVDAVEVDEGYELCDAAADGDLAVMLTLLDRAAGPDRLLCVLGGRNGNTALMCAAEDGHVEAMRVMLAHPGADAAGMLAQANEYEKTALMRASRNEHVACMSLLLDHPRADAAAMLGHIEINGRNIFYEAASRGHAGAIGVCLAHPQFSAAAMLKNTTANRDSFARAAMSGHAETVRLLLDHQPRAVTAVMLAREEGMGSTILSYAASIGRVAVMRLILDHLSAAEAASRMVFTDVFTMAAGFTVNAAAGQAAADGARNFAPLLLLLRHLHEQAQPSDARQTAAAMSGAMETLSPLLELDGEPCAARDCCVRLLLELGATGYDSSSLVTSRVIRERLAALTTLLRTPRLINEYVVGMATVLRAQQEQELRP